MPIDEPNIGTARELQDQAEFMLDRARELAREAGDESDKKKRKKLEEEARDFAEKAQEITRIAREMIQR